MQLHHCSLMLRKALRAKSLVCIIVCLLLLNYFGAFTHIFERDFYTDFNYPLEGDVLKYARQLRNGQSPAVPPINTHYNYSFIFNAGDKCLDGDRALRPRLVILVKSALEHFENRLMIRQSWGYEKRFSDVIIRTVFLLGSTMDTVLSNKIRKEAETYKDVVQANFTDTYFNNTIKTMIGMKWAVTYCPTSKFYFFVDDDYYVSIKNVLMFIRNPVNYPEYLEDAQEVMRKAARRLSSTNKYAINKTYDVLLSNGKPVEDTPRVRTARHILDYELADEVRLFTGYVFTSSPHRHKSSKFYTTLSEYPWHLWPTYVTAGAYILSKEALLDMYYCSFYTKHFRFDDIFLGLVAMKAHIEPLHSEQFYFHRAPFTQPNSYKYLVASHGYSNPKDMFNIWTQCRSAGYA